MFIVGVTFMSIGYALAYYGIDVLSWSRSTNVDKTRPVPFRYLLGLTIPTTPPNDQFHPPFTLNDVDRTNAAIALGAQGPGAIAGDPGAIPNSQVPPADPGTPDPPGYDRNNKNQGILPILPGEGGNQQTPYGAV